MMDSLETIWIDLRDRRLLPVVIGLLLAIIAVPILLSKSSNPSSSPGAGPVRASGLPGALGVDADGADGPSSGGMPAEVVVRPLDVRKATTGDPFSGPSGTASSSSAPSGSPGADGMPTPPSLSSGPAGSAVPVAPLGAGSSPAAPHGTSSGNDGGDPTKPPNVPDHNGTDNGNGSPDPRPTEPPPSAGDGGTASYIYVADVKFGQLGSERKLHGIKRLRALPHSGRPVLTFVGLTSSREQAVFTVGAGVEVSGGRSASHSAGDGNCRPKRSNCNFLYLPVGGAVSHAQDSVLVDRKDRRYRIKVLAIRRVRESPDASGSTAGDGDRDVSTEIERVAAEGKVRAFIHRGDQLPVLEDR